jgi:nucleolar GTP-binding protein
VTTFENHLSDLGIDASAAVERARSRSRSRSRSRADSAARAAAAVGQKRKRSESRGLSAGIRDAKLQKTADDMQKSFEKRTKSQARKGEGDRHISPKLPKHLFSGKRKMGTHDRR